MEELTPAVKFEPVDELVINDLETLKVLADPLRVSILECLKKPATVKQIAAKIDRPPTKLYYHFNLLEKHGIIQMVDTRIVSGIVEKHYQAAAKLYRPDENLLAPGHDEFDETITMLLNSILGQARSDILTSIKAGVAETDEAAPKYKRVMMLRANFSLSPERAEEFYDRFYDLLREYDDDEESSDSDDEKTYKLVFLMHPTPESSD